VLEDGWQILIFVQLLAVNADGEEGWENCSSEGKYRRGASIDTKIKLWRVQAKEAPTDSTLERKWNGGFATDTSLTGAWKRSQIRLLRHARWRCGLFFHCDFEGQSEKKKNWAPNFKQINTAPEIVVKVWVLPTVPKNQEKKSYIFLFRNSKDSQNQSAYPLVHNDSKRSTNLLLAWRKW
jgi:hypothetical protein